MDFVALRKIFLPISVVLAVTSVVLLFAPGLNLGIDFVSGTSTTYDFASDDPGSDAVNDALVASGHPEAIVQNLGEGQYPRPDQRFGQRRQECNRRRVDAPDGYRTDNP